MLLFWLDYNRNLKSIVTLSILTYLTQKQFPRLFGHRDSIP